jgi:WD40 repeat protein
MCGELDRYDPISKSVGRYLGGISAEMTDFSRDGKYVAYVSFPDGILWRANRDGSGQVQLSEPPLYPRNPHWSPDGSKILFTDNTQNGVDAIYIISSQGGNPKRVLADNGEPQSLADWSPDGTKIVYTVHPGFSFIPRDESKIETRIVELATGKVNILPKSPHGFWAPLWSPDGRYIAGHSIDHSELVIFDLKMGRWITLPPKGSFGFHNWSHDSRFLYFLSWIKDKVGVYRVAAQGGKEELVLDLSEDYQIFSSTGYYGIWFSLDPTDAPLLLRNVGTDEIYALTLERE